MEHLKNKSEINEKAAEYLQEKNFYPAVVHCIYYSCVQLMRHIWLNVMNKTEGDLRNSQNNSKQGSHEILINQVEKYIGNKRLEDERRVFKSKIGELKKLRVRSDYNNELIDYSKSQGAIKNLKDINKILKKCL